MKAKAIVNFAGEICMAVGEVRDIKEDVAAPLLKCGYLELMQNPDQEQASETEDTQESEADQKQDSDKSKSSRGKRKVEG